jgi:hypothetical protein
MSDGTLTVTEREKFFEITDFFASMCQPGCRERIAIVIGYPDKHRAA